MRNNPQSKISEENRQKKRFFKFLFLVLMGFILGFLTIRRGHLLTAESFKAEVLALGIWGPIIYTGLFVIRPLLLIPSIALFVAGGLAFGPVIGPLLASTGAAMGGSLGFWIARTMGHEYVKSKLKLGKGLIDTTRFSFYAVFLLSLIPVMPVTPINYGAGLSTMRFGNYLTAHVLGIVPRAFVYGFFGDTLLEIGSPRFRIALLLLILFFLFSWGLKLFAKQAKILRQEHSKQETEE